MGLTRAPGASGSGRPSVRRRRRFFFFANARFAASSAPGAITTSVKMAAIISAVGPSSGRFSATMPPKALTGSQRSAAS